MRALPKPLSFEWDEGNVNKNFIKHNVTDKEAEEVFSRRLKFFKDLKHSQKEHRFVALGTTKDERRLYIVFTIRNQKIRIISARNQSGKEKRLYEKKG